MKKLLKIKHKEKPPKQHWCEHYHPESCPNTCSTFEEYPHCAKAVN